VPDALDKKGGRKFSSMFRLCLIKDGTGFPLFLSNEPGTGISQCLLAKSTLLILNCLIKKYLFAKEK
jgi:hypothetical protein